jgi:hypothetical protein
MKHPIAAALVCLSTSGLAMNALAMNAVGTPVNKIMFASNIDGWKVVDKQRLIVSTGPNRHYLITLDRASHQLSFAHNVGLTSSNNTVYSGFDQVVIEGARYAIKTIARIDRDDIHALIQA